MKADNQTSEQGKRLIDIELLAIDLNSCTRCVGTLGNIEKAIDMVHPVLEEMEIQVNVRKIVVESEEQARQHKFTISPTVRINGEDIVFEVIESKCDSCTDLCGCEEGTNCRVWSYRGKEFNEAPVGLVAESILRMVLDEDHNSGKKTPEFKEVPENLKQFFSSKSEKETSTQTCCTPDEQETCCEPSEKETCCETSEPETCGCQ